MFRIIKFLFIITVIGFVFLLGWIYYLWQAPGISSESINFVIPKNTSAKKICILLKEKGLIRSELLTRAYLRLSGIDNMLPSGEFLLHRGYTPGEIMSILKQKKRPEIQITLPEGLTLKKSFEIINRDLKHINLEEMERTAINYPLKDISFLSGESYSLEGMIFPETYRFYEDSTFIEVLTRIIEEFESRVEGIFKKTGKTLTNENFYEALILASIVEKEAGVIKEMPKIAGVFINRLKGNIPLESCATVQYALGTRKPILTYEDIKIKSVYNTYLHKGLPPGPICSPSESAILSVLSPEVHDYLYFVSKGDGTHIFSKNLKEHNRAKRLVKKGKKK